MLRKFWKRSLPSSPSQEQPTRGVELELSDADLEKVAGGLERAFPPLDDHDTASGTG